MTSDLHLNHKNILKYEPEARPFETVEEMNNRIISNWNNVVNENDTVYVLGDMCMGKLDEIPALINQLKGKIILVRGNHDQENRIKLYKELGIEVKDIAYLEYKGRFFIMCHFPMTNPEFTKMVIKDNSEVVMLYGHLHSNAPKGYVDGSYHVGMDTNDLTPISIHQVWKECLPTDMNEQNKAYKAKYECGGCPEEDNC
jgi:calcineurin-like phosphoesterase family protein